MRKFVKPKERLRQKVKPKPKPKTTKPHKKRRVKVIVVNLPSADQIIGSDKILFGSKRRCKR